VELVLIGPPGSGKTALGRRVAAHHGVPFIDLDDAIEEAAGRPVRAIFESEGEAGFRARERAAVMALGSGRGVEARLTRVIAAGGGAVMDPRNRWRLFRGRRVVALRAPAEVLLRRLHGGPVRPLLAGRDPGLVLGELMLRRERWYGAGEALDATGTLGRVAGRLEALLSTEWPAGTTLLRAETPIGRLSIGDGDAARQVIDALAALDARRAAVVSEPAAWRLHGERLTGELRTAGLDVVPLLVPRGEAAKTVRAWGLLLRAMAAARLERRDPLIAVGGGALGDAAGFAAATYLRGVPLVHVPTTLVAQIDSAIGGKTAIDIPEGKNLVGAFHQPRAIAIDVGVLGTLPARQLRAALGEAIKYGALGDERLLELLENEGARIARGGRAAFESGAVAELVERCAWAKVEVVSADEREEAGRIVLNLGHSIGHALEAAAGYRRLLHGEAVAHGLRGALAVGAAVGVTPPDRAQRVERLLEATGLAQDPPGVEAGAVLELLARDKKHAGGRLRWVLPTGSGVVVRSDVPEAAVSAGIAAALSGARATAVGSR
jgi:shikimate kinase/3-dehydroquinate synthase